MKKVLYYISAFCIFFLFINFILALLWKPINENILSKIFKKNHYSKELIELIGIKDQEQYEFYREMWVKRKYKFVQFAEHLEAKTENQKYVNITENYGRQIKNNNECKTKYFFYGDSQVFGYNVTDDNTIPAFFKIMLDSNYSNKSNCVYNFGSAGYFSTQENILLMRHILQNKIEKNDYAIFLNGYAESGNKSSMISKQLQNIFDGLDLKLWEELKFSTNLFLNSLPLIKLYKNLKKKISSDKKVLDINQNISFNENLNETKKVFNINVTIRNSICKEMKINCYTFLKPFPKIHGTIAKKFTMEELSFWNKKYLKLKEVKNVIDISNVLNNQNIKSYIDGAHFSPISNKLIATEIFKTIIY